MAAPVIRGAFRFGDDGGLLFAGSWNEVDPSGSASDRTRGLLTVTLDGVPVWGGGRVEPASAVEWTWIELLEGLAESWRFLRWRETYPEPLRPRHPGEIETRLAELGETKPASVLDAVGDEVYEWLERQDMARWLRGLSARPLRLLRQGKLVVVAGGARVAWLPADDVFAALERLGGEIGGRISGATDERSAAAVAAWRARERCRPVELAAIYTGLSEGDVEGLGFRPSPGAEFEPDELLAAARMVPHSLRLRDTVRLMKRIRRVRRTTSSRLDTLTVHAAGVRAEVCKAAPFEQGRVLAREMRADLPGGSRSAWLDIERMLRELAVAVLALSLGEAEAVDAVAVWGPRHGPAVLLNKRGLHARSRAGSRATLAHELCHLLIDRDGALPLVDVLGGRAAIAVESRANAFAAELLMPQSVVTDRPGAGALLVEDCKRLFRRYEVSRQLGAWQILNSGVELTLGTRRQLEIWSRGFAGDASCPS